MRAAKLAPPFFHCNGALNLVLKAVIYIKTCKLSEAEICIDRRYLNDDTFILIMFKALARALLGRCPDHQVIALM